MGKQARLRKERAAAKSFIIAREQKIVETFADVAPRILFKYFKGNSCVNSVRVLIDVMEAWDIPVQPLACAVLVYNRVYWDKLLAKNNQPESQEEMDQWCAEGGWALGIGDGAIISSPDEPDWDWHLIGVTQSTIIDPTSCQMTRPDKGIILPDCLLSEMTRKFAVGLPKWLEMPNNGAIAVYHPQPQIQNFRKFPGFQRSDRNRDVARLITHAVDRQLPPELKL